MKITEHPGHFEVTLTTVQSSGSSSLTIVPAAAGTISGKPSRKRALQEAMTFAGAEHTILGLSGQQDQPICTAYRGLRNSPFQVVNLFFPRFTELFSFD
jgi:hypothetical protein